MQPRTHLLCVIILTLAFSHAAGAESDISGWGKSKWGMTHTEVNKLYALEGWEPGDSTMCRMKDKITIPGHAFVVACYFDQRSKKGQLFKVVLVHFNRNRSKKAWLNEISKMLMEKYGGPTSFEIVENMKICRWVKPEGQLKLSTLASEKIMCALEYLAVRTEGQKL